MKNRQNIKAVLINIIELAFLPFPEHLKYSLTLLFRVIANSLFMEFLNLSVDWALLYFNIFYELGDFDTNKRSVEGTWNITQFKMAIKIISNKKLNLKSLSIKKRLNVSLDKWSVANLAIGPLQTSLTSWC